MNAADKQRCYEQTRAAVEPIVADLASALQIDAPSLSLKLRGACYIGMDAAGEVKLEISYGIVSKAPAPLLRALIAHELAHVKLGHVRRDRVVQDLRELWAKASLVLHLPNPCWRDEFAADRMAAEVAGAEAMGALIACLHRVDELAFENWSHPSSIERIKRLAPDTKQLALLVAAD